MNEELIEELAAEERSRKAYEQRLEANLECELERDLKSLNLDGTYDRYLNEFFNLSSRDIERLSGWYEAPDLCWTLEKAWVKAAANLPG